MGSLMSVTLIIIILKRPLQSKKDGWYRSIDASLSASMQTLYKLFVEASFKVEAYKCDIDSQQFGVKGAILDMPHNGLTITLWKDGRDRRSTIVFIETQYKFDMDDVDSIIAMVEGSLVRR